MIYDFQRLKLESLHLDAIRTIIGAVRGTSHQKLYAESGFTTLRERRFRHKIICTTRLFKKIPRLTWKNIYPHLFPQPVHTIDDDHSNDRYQNTRLRLTGNHFSHRQLHCGIIYRKTYSEQNQLVKLNTLQKWHKSPPFFYNGSRKAQITYCKLRLGISDLNYDLLNRHLTTYSSCDCGERKETSEHFILHCPRFTHVRQNTIFRLPANLLNITTLLQGNPNISNNMNSLIFKLSKTSLPSPAVLPWNDKLN